MARSESHPEKREVVKSTWKSSHPHHSASTPVTRTNSEASLYMPVRRSSIIQIPGVATRPQQTTRILSSRPSFLNTLLQTPGQSRRNSIESIATRRMPVPSAQVALEPCEAEYKQLGGMKFGSLRITNGAPEFTPSPHDEENTSYGPTLTTSMASRGYFEMSKSHSVIATGDPDDVQNEEGLNMAPRKSDHKLADLAGATATSCDIKSPTKAVETGPLHQQGDDARKLDLTTPIEAASPTTPLRITSKHNASEDQLFEKGGTTLDYSAGEVLDIRDGPSAKTNSERNRLKLEMPQKALSKADSSYSPKVVLQPFHSLKPLATDKTHVSSEKPTSEVPECRTLGNSEPTSAGCGKHTRKHDRSKSELPPPPPRDNIPAILGRRSSLSSLARNTINRIPTLRTSISRDSGSSRTRTMPSSEPAIANPAKPDPPNLEVIGNANHNGKLQRLFSGRRVKGPPKIHDDPPIDQCTPAIPCHAPGRPRKHKRGPSTPPHRRDLRSVSSKRTQRTILSAGSTDMLQNGETSLANDTQPRPPHGTFKSGTTRKRSLHSLSHLFSQATTNLLLSKKSVSERKVGTRKIVEHAGTHPDTIRVHEARACGLRNVLPNMGSSPFDQAFTATTADRSSPFSIRKKMLTKMHPMERRSKEQIRPLPHETRESRPNVATTEDWPLSPSVIELSHLNRSKTRPSVSVRTRSINNLRVPSSGRSRSAPPSEGPPVPPFSFSSHSSQKRVHSYQSTQSLNRPVYSPLPTTLDSRLCSEQSRGPQSPGKTPWHARSGSQPLKQISKPTRGSTPNQQTAGGYSIARPGIAVPGPGPCNGQPRRRRSRSGGQEASPAWPPNHSSQMQLQELWILNQQHWQLDHCPNNSQGHSDHGTGSSANGLNPPFRILHSYNSPAYRVVPIWG